MHIFVRIKLIRFNSFRINGYAISSIFKTYNRLRNMHTIKEILNFLDLTIATFWGFTIIDLSSSIVGGGFVLSTIDNVIKVLFALVGLVYTVIRMRHFYLKSEIDRLIRKEELEVLERENNKKEKL